MKNSSTKFFDSRRFAPFGIALSIFGILLFSGLTQAEAQTYTLSNVWSSAAASTCRSIAYSAVSNQVLVATTAPAISVLDGTAGTSIGSVGVSWLTAGTGTFKLDQIAVADDGAIYGGTLQTAVSSANVFKIFRWGSWNDTNQIISYAADPLTGTALDNTTKRIGDTMTVTGSGTNTLILCGISAQNSFVLFSTLDGTNFTPTVLTVSAGLVAPAGNLFGLAFYTNNTFLLKPESSINPYLYLIQFPSNFASLTSPVTATVLATNTVAASSGSALPVISYSSAGSLMAMQSNSTTVSGIYLYAVTNFTSFSSGATLLTSATYACPTGNGNLTEAVALGGIGKTNWVYGMDTANTVQAYKINSTAAAVGPTITGPVGISGAYPPQTLSVTESGTQPVTNLWYSNTASNTIGGTLVQSSTNTSYTITTAVTNYYYVVATNAGGSQTSSVVLVSLKPLTTNSVVSQLFSVPNGAPGFTYLANDDNTRGMAYDAVTGRLVVANKTGGVANLYLVDGTTGAAIATLNTTGMLTPAGETFPVDQVGVADDGVVYACNLVFGGSGASFALTSWATATTNSTPYSAFQADPGSGANDRWGDTMDVRGAGTSTQILLASRGTNMALLTATGDGTNFSTLVIPVPGVPPGFAGAGVVFGAGNTFWAKSNPNGPGGSGDLYQISFDPTGAASPTILLDYQVTTQIPLDMSGIGVDSVHAILAGVDLADRNNDLQLFQLTGNSNSPVLFDQAVFPNFVSGDNGNHLGVVSMKYPRVYGMSVDNGIIGLTYGVPVSTPPTITPGTPTGATIYSAASSFSISPTVSGTLPLNYQWQFNTVSNLATATNIPGATGGSYTFSFPSTNATGWYDVIVTNFGGKATSAPVLITVIPPVTNSAVTNLWTLSPGSRPYLDAATSFATRGLAYDTNSGYLLVSDHATTNIYVLNGADGSDAFQMGPFLGITNGTFPLNLVAVADDGAVYFADLAITQGGGGGDAFVMFAAPSPTSSFNPTPVFSGDPGNGAGERWGDTLAIRGSGTNTQILLGSYGQGAGPGINVALLTTTDGTTFTALTIPVAGAPAGFSSLGLAFGAGNTFWAKGGHNYDLRQISFDPTGVTPAAVLQDYVAPTQIPNDLPGLAVDVANNILGGVNLNDTPRDFQLYQLTGNTNSPVLFDQVFYVPGTFSDSQDNAQAVLKFPGHGVNYGVGFALGVNNGIVAITYNAPFLPFPLTATNITGTGLVLSWPSFTGHNYAVRQRASLTAGSWSTNSFRAGTGSTMFFTNSSPTGPAQFYGVVAQ